MTGRTGVGAGAVAAGPGGVGEEPTGRRPEGEAGQGVVTAFGKTLKTLRVRAGMEREAFGKLMGYSASSIASFEQGRRIPPPRFIDKADDVLGTDGLLKVWKKEVEKALETFQAVDRTRVTRSSVTR